MNSPAPSTDPGAAPRRELGLVDCVCIVVGIIIGTGIYKSAPDVAAHAGGPLWMLLAWVLGGAVSLAGALCHAELTTAYPREGGDYVFLTRAFGRSAGFLFSWAEFWIVRPGSLGAMAYVLADYALPGGGGAAAHWLRVGIAATAIGLLTVVNILGVRAGKWTQNVLTFVKVLGLAAVFLVGLWLLPAAGSETAPSAGSGNFPLALILVLFAYGGWNEVSYVAAEVRDPRRNIFLALTLGTALVALVYVLVNVALLRGLGYEAMSESTQAASDLLYRAGGVAGRQAIGLLICVSALGAINGMILTGARVFYALGTEHRPFAWLGKWNARFGTPARSLALQGTMALAMTVGFGAYANGFERLVVFTAPFFWFFRLLAVLAVVALRWREPEAPRPYRVAGYPFTPAVFAVACLYMLYASLAYAYAHEYLEAAWSVLVMVVGLAIAWREASTSPTGASTG